MTTNNLYFAVLLLLLISSCSKNSDSCDPNMICYTVAPDSGSVYVEVSINSESPYVPVVIYNGRVEDNDIIFFDTLTTSSGNIYTLPYQNRYSAKATYKEGSKTIIAYDGGKLKYGSENNCNETCYSNKDLTIDLKLLAK